LDDLPQPQLHLGCFGWEELKRDARRTGIEIGHRVGGEQAAGLPEVLRHQRSSLASSVSGTSSCKFPVKTRERCAVQITTVSGSPGSRRGGTPCRPAALHHSATSLSVKPSRRWACSSRRNSSEWGAKSTSTKTPPGRTTRAASA